MLEQLLSENTMHYKKRCALAAAALVSTVIERFDVQFLLYLRQMLDKLMAGESIRHLTDQVGLLGKQFRKVVLGVINGWHFHPL